MVTIQHVDFFLQCKARGAQNRSVIILREDSSTTATWHWRKRAPCGHLGFEVGSSFVEIHQHKYTADEQYGSNPVWRWHAEVVDEGTDNAV